MIFSPRCEPHCRQEAAWLPACPLAPRLPLSPQATALHHLKFGLKLHVSSDRIQAPVLFAQSYPLGRLSTKDPRDPDSK